MDETKSPALTGIRLGLDQHSNRNYTNKVLRSPLRVANGSQDGQDDALVDIAGYKPRVPDGDYLAACLGHKTAFIFKTAKVFVRFSIITPGAHFGCELFKPYRVQKLIGHPRIGGRFVLRPGGDLFSDLVRLLHIRQRPDRISLRPLKCCIWRIRTRTVQTDYAQRSLPEWQHYSVVDRIIELEAGSTAVPVPEPVPVPVPA